MQTFDRPGTIARGVIVLILIVQLVLGVVFTFAPQAFAHALGLPPAPAWTDWMFAQFGARALGFAYGMRLALRDPRANAGWLRAMVLVQAIDWLGTLAALFAGKVTWLQTSTAPFLPVLFVVVLVLELRRQAVTSAARIEAA